MNQLAQLTQNTTTFVVLEASVAWYLVNPDGTPGSDVLFGGIVDRMVIKDSFKEKPFQVPGNPYTSIYHEDETHEVEMDSLREWLAGPNGLTTIPAIGRNQKLFMVVVWLDADNGAWNQRTYVNATSPSQTIPGDGKQTLRFVAEAFIELTGLSSVTPPTLTPAASPGQVWYVASGASGAARTLLYAYDGTAKVLTAFAASTVLAATATINVGATEMDITFVATQALAAIFADGAAAVKVKSLTARGTTYSTDATSARLEFWLYGSRLATLTALGEMVVPDLIEQNDEAADGIEGEDGNLDWLFTLDARGGIAAEFEEVASF